MNFRWIAMAALLWATSAATSHAALPPGISGTWYNPAQSGHGVSLEILDQTRAIGGWYVYDALGNPIHLYFEGTIRGTIIESNAYLARGMRFGSFNPSDNRVLPWGKVTIEFSSCDAATLRWNADGAAGAGYGSGELPLRRLTRIAGQSCVFPSTVQSLLPTGTYTGSWDRAAGGHGTRPYPLFAAVDSQGRLWAAPEFTPGVTFVSALYPPPTFIGSVGVQDGARVVQQIDVKFNVGFVHTGTLRDPGITLPVSFSVTTGGAVSASAQTSARPSLVEHFIFARDPLAVDSLQQPGFDPASLVGRTFRVPTLEQFFGPLHVDVHFRDAHRFCIPEAECTFSGSIGAVDPGLAMFDIEIDDTRQGGTTYVGKAWLTGSPQRLVFVAHDGLVAMAGVGMAR